MSDRITYQLYFVGTTYWYHYYVYLQRLQAQEFFGEGFHYIIRSSDGLEIKMTEKYSQFVKEHLGSDGIDLSVVSANQVGECSSALTSIHISPAASRECFKISFLFSFSFLFCLDGIPSMIRCVL